jgi:hypothetical protein
MMPLGAAVHIGPARDSDTLLAMERRRFAQTIAGAAAWPAVAPGQSSSRKTRIFRLDYWFIRPGNQGTRINDFLASQIALITRNTQALGIFTALIGPRVPATLVVTGFGSLEEMTAAEERVRGNAEYRAAFEKMEQGPESPYDGASASRSAPNRRGCSNSASTARPPNGNWAFYTNASPVRR